MAYSKLSHFLVSNCSSFGRIGPAFGQHRSSAPVYVVSFYSVQWLNKPPVFLKSVFKMFSLMKMLFVKRKKKIIASNNKNTVNASVHMSMSRTVRLSMTLIVFWCTSPIINLAPSVIFLIACCESIHSHRAALYARSVIMG